MKKLSYITLFLLLANFVDAKVVDKFNQFNAQDFTTTDNITLEFSSSVVKSSPGALKVIRNIKYDSSPTVQWTEGNEVNYSLPSPVDFSSEGYFIFWYYDEENYLTGNGAASLQVGLYDGDEWWYSTHNLTAIGWGQMCIPLKGTSATNDVSLDGFAVPSWERNDPAYTGNLVFNKSTIQQIKFAFGAGHDVVGNFYIDDISGVPLVFKSIPINNAYINHNITDMKVYFGEKMASGSVTQSTDVLIRDKTSSSFVSKSLSYDTNNNILTINGFTLTENHNYEIVLTNIFFEGGEKSDTYRINFTAKFPPTFSSSISNSVQDYSDGFYVSLPAGSINSSTIIDIENGTSDFGALKVKQVYPLNQELSKTGAIIFFTDGYENYTGLKILQKNQEGYWKEIPSVWYKDEGYIKGTINSFGEFALVEDYNSERRENILTVKPLSNPFTPNSDGINDTVWFDYQIAYGGKLSVKIYNSAGFLVRTLGDKQEVSEGSHQDIFWDGKDDRGQEVSDGIYIYVFTLERGIFASSEYYTWYENAPEVTEIRGVIGVIK